MLVGRRLSKLFKLSTVVVLLGLAFVSFHQYNASTVLGTSSLKEYTDYIQNYVGSYYTNSGQNEGTATVVQEEDLTGVAAPEEEEEQFDNVEKWDTDLHTPDNSLKREYLEKVFDLLRVYSPEGSSEKNYNKDCKITGAIGGKDHDSDNWYKLTRKELSNCLEVSSAETSLLKESHQEYVQALNQLVSQYDVTKLYNGGKGIVIVGGDKFSLLALLTISVLRDKGTTLPVEVFIPPVKDGNNSEDEFCTLLKNEYNAKCIRVSDVMGKEVIENFEFKGYQYKSLAMLLSSFKDMLFLDADNYPMKNLDNIFDSEPYLRKGLVLWPDFWRRTTQPVFYEITDMVVNTKKRVRNCIDEWTPPAVYSNSDATEETVPLHDYDGALPDLSTESGQILLNKHMHWKTMLLSQYYNVNGPSWYYPILSQKVAGEGDKETFISAATYFHLPYYQVKTNVGVEGYHKPDDSGFRGVAMLQHDFIQDYDLYKAASLGVQSKYSNISTGSIPYDPSYKSDQVYKEYFGATEDEEVDIMFVHAQLPKFDPLTLWKDQDFITDGQHIRSFTKLSKIKNYDIELENFEKMDNMLCSSENQTNKTLFGYLVQALGDDQEKWDSFCKYISDRHEFLKSTHS